MELQEDQIQALSEFAFGKRSWNQWPSWFAVNAAKLVKQLDRDVFLLIKMNPHEGICKILNIEIEDTRIAYEEEPFLRDPIENDPEIRIYIETAYTEAIQELGANISGQMGECHIIWNLQKRILKEKFGVDWKTPAEMNEDIIFD